MNIIKDAQPFVDWDSNGPRDWHRLFLRETAPMDFHYVQPFIGDGSALFFMLNHCDDNMLTVTVNDERPEMTNAYRIVRDLPHELVAALFVRQKRYEGCRSNHARQSYFNEVLASFNLRTMSCVEQASAFIFLNKTCAGNIYAENKKGELIVLFGGQANLLICDADGLYRASQALSGVTIFNGEYSASLSCHQGDAVVYCCLPADSSASRVRTLGTSRCFGETEHRILRAFCDTMANKGCRIIVDTSMSDASAYLSDVYSGYELETSEYGRISMVRDFPGQEEGISL